MVLYVSNEVDDEETLRDRKLEETILQIWTKKDTQMYFFYHPLTLEVQLACLSSSFGQYYRN